MKLKYALKKAINLKTGYLIAIVLALILMIGGYFSYAVFTASSESKGALNIVTGNLYSLITSIDLDENKTIKIAPNETKNIEIKLTNTNGINTKVNLYYQSSSTTLEVGYLEAGDKAPTKAGYVLEKHGNSGDTKTILIKLINKDANEVSVTFGSDAGLPNAELAFPENMRSLELIEGVATNTNITKAFIYNEDESAENYCVTGEEETCALTSCYENDLEGSCEIGTIIKYRVKEDTEHFFYVLHDDGEKMTLQQRENTVTSKWHDVPTAERNNRTGPLTAISVLENTTADWINVNDQTYEMGKTVFSDNFYTGCYGTCTINRYTWPEKTSKARMITAQEAVKIGCTYGAKMCPLFAYNYQPCSYDRYGSKATKCEGDDCEAAIWTMTASNQLPDSAIAIDCSGILVQALQVINAPKQVRAVVEINKK